MSWTSGPILVKKQPLSLLTQALGYTKYKGHSANNGIKIHDEGATDLFVIIIYCYPKKANNDMMSKLFQQSICAKVDDP